MKIIGRSLDRLPTTVKNRADLSVIVTSFFDLSDTEMFTDVSQWRLV